MRLTEGVVCKYLKIFLIHKSNNKVFVIKLNAHLKFPNKLIFNVLKVLSFGEDLGGASFGEDLGGAT